MRVLRLYYLLPPKLGGMEKHISNLTKFQSKQNEVSIFFNFGNKVSENDVKLLSFIKLFKIQPLVLGIVLFYIAVIFKLLFKRKEFDIIHMHGDWSSLMFMALIKRIAKAKVTVFTTHGQLTNSFTHRKLLPKLVKNLDLVFSTGYETGKKLSFLSNRDVIIQPSGILNIFFKEREKFTRNEVFKVISVSNLFPIKNIDLIIAVAKKLPDFIFTIVGDGPERKRLEDLINDSKLTNVILVGLKNSKEIKRYYDSSDCCILTSFAEGTPTSILEAMACGLPIVASNAGGLKNIVIENKNGFVIDNFDVNKFVEKLIFLKENDKLSKAISENNIALSKKYSWDNVAKTITNKIEESFRKKK